MEIEKAERPETNPDPITGAPGAHPVGVGLGAAAGGLAAGAAAGTLAAGPIGTVVGAAVGALVGGLAGKGAAEAMNPTQDPPAPREIDLRALTGAAAADRTVEAVAGRSYSAARATIDSGDGITHKPGASHLIDPKVGVTAADPTGEDAYWRATYRDEPYYSSSRSYDDYAPAYRLGHQRRTEYGGTYDASEQLLAGEWERAKGASRLTWTEANRAAQAAWNRLEPHSLLTDSLPLNRPDTSHSPSNPPPLTPGAFQRLASDAITSPELAAMATGHSSDAAHAASEQTADHVAVAGDWDDAPTSDRKVSEAVNIAREAVRRRPFAAIGIGMAFGFLLVGGPSLSRAISRARWF